MKKSTVTIMLLLLFSLGYSQTAQNNKDSVAQAKAAKKDNSTFIINPTIGLGIGSLKYYGDISSFHRGNPIVGIFSYKIDVENAITKYLSLQINMLWGNMSMNEISPTRHLNFKTRVTTGGLSFNYNFANFLKPKRSISPFISVGIESVEFDSKADMYDQYGNEYNYWSDGTIRNIPESSPDAAKAIVIERDYTYETDLRKQNDDGKGTYPLTAFAIPVGIGARMHLSKYLQFVVSTTMHFGFSDIIDNVTKSSEGPRLGDINPTHAKDKFLYTAISFHYSFKGKEQETITNPFPFADYLAGDNSDQDHDGINDFIDSCPNTPAGIKVYPDGCPYDGDKDGVPDFRDLDLATKSGVPVLPNGKEYTDTLIHLDYLAYLDSTGFFGADTVNEHFTVGRRTKQVPKTYMVQIGAFKTGISAKMVDKFLRLPDIKVHNFGDTLTVFTVGNYKNLPDAIRRKIALTKQGYDQAEVVTNDKKGNIVSAGDEINNMIVKAAKPTTSNEQPTTNNQQPINNNIIYRIQIGAFSKKVSKSTFSDVSDLQIIKMKDHLYHYHSGSFEKLPDAKNALHKIKNKGYNDAFIVSYKNGNQVQEINPSNTQNTENTTNPESTNTNKIDKKFVYFTVQLGIFRDKVPNNVFAHYLQLGDVHAHVEGALTRFTAGKFKTFDAAENAKNKLQKEGFPGAFLVSFYKDKLISLDQAKDAIK